MGNWRNIYTDGWVSHFQDKWYFTNAHSAKWWVNNLLMFLHPQGLKCSHTLPWCCTSLWRSLTGPTPQRLFWRTQVPLGGTAEPASQPGRHTHREVHTPTHTRRSSQPGFTILKRVPILPNNPFTRKPHQDRTLTGFAGFNRVCKIFQPLICSLAVWPVNRYKRKLNHG